MRDYDRKYRAKNPQVNLTLRADDLQRLDDLRADGESRAAAARRLLLQAMAAARPWPYGPKSY